MTPWTFDPCLVWKPLTARHIKGILANLLPARLAGSKQLGKLGGWAATLPFYKQFSLVCLTRLPDQGVESSLFLLHGPKALILDGSSLSIHAANVVEDLNLPPELRANYLRFFCAFVRGENGLFRLLEDSASIQDPGSTAAHAGKNSKLLQLLAQIRTKLGPLTAEEPGDAKESRFAAIIVYGKEVFECAMLVESGGQVTMESDDGFGEGIPETVFPAAPTLCGLAGFLPELGQTLPGENVEKSLAAGASRHRSGESAPDRDTADRDITRLYVMVLLKHAISALGGDSLIDLFNAGAGVSGELHRFTRFVFSAWPVVAIESDLPFVEEMIAEILSARSSHGHVPVVAATSESDDGRVRLKVHEKRAIVALPLNIYRSVVDLERVAHEISTNEVAALIACQRLADLPEPLRRAVDLVLTLPGLDETHFAELFPQIFGGPLPARWRQGGEQWIRYLLPTDFHPAAKLGLKGLAAIRFLRERVNDRLTLVAPSNGPALKDLHGLVEAKQMAEDLITDIRDALKGCIPWSAVDRGMLLAGPPGTGKTSLALAVAKTAGVRFVSASAASWQSAGHLGDHLRAMRASFAEARRYAPAILFIDEMDSFGRRDDMRGENGQYHTQVVNALLELLQGVDEKEPVIVLAATNYADRVDPALRRAGRLDRTVPIPYPNVEALSSIFDYYLRNKAVVGEPARNIDSRALGELAFGLTGADVESFVRGAARRARKEGKALGQEHLLAEVTGKARHPDGAGRLTGSDMRQVAVHESGHALARLLTNDTSSRLSYVSIVPRGDGSLGFVASTPSSHQVMTRTRFHELIEVILAGRAAEELVFGAMGISGGAGGRSDSSDLAIATRLATDLVCRQAMGKSGSLVWLNQPGEEQRDEISAVLGERYSAILGKLGNYRNALEALADELVKHQELSGPEVEALVAPLTKRRGKRGTRNPGAGS